MNQHKDAHLSPLLSLVVPCYNEEQTLQSCIQRILPLASNTLRLEIVVVDDCSKDNSYNVAQALAAQYPEITVIKHHKNMGKGAALRSGFVQANGDYIGIQDADMEYNPMEYLTMLEPLLSGKADVVYGSRYLRPDARRVLYFWHTWMNKTLTTLSNMFTNLDITDMETCYKLFKREVLQGIAPSLKEERFGFEPEITAKVAQSGCNVYECAISYNPRTIEEGKKINWKDGVRALYCILHYGAHTAPLPMQLILYFLIGSLSAMANVWFFAMAITSGLSIFFATALAFVVAVILNYFLCIFLLFRHKARWSALGELGMYGLVLGIMFVFDYSVTAGFIIIGLGPVWSKTWAAALGFFLNFVLRKYIVFPEKKPKEPILEPLLRKWRIRKILPSIQTIKEPTILDVGCGVEAKLLHDLEPYIKQGVGVDFKCLEQETDTIKTMQVSLGQRLPFEDNSFDIITMLAVVEHLEHHESIIREAFRVLKPGGVLIGTTPSRLAKPVLEFLSFKLGIVSKEEILDHKRYYNKQDITDLMRQAGFENCEHHYFQAGMNNFFCCQK